MFFLVFVLFTSHWSVRKVLDCFFLYAPLCKTTTIQFEDFSGILKAHRLNSYPRMYSTLPHCKVGITLLRIDLSASVKNLHF